MTYALVRKADGRVVNWLRDDLPQGYFPPAGHTLVERSKLPAGWREADPAPQSVPESITAVQARLWLIRDGIGLEAIDAAIGRIEDATDRESVRVWWEYEPVLRRGSPQIARWGDACGFTAAQIDDAFRAAAQVQP